MSDIPYLPLYVNDFEGDTAHLSLEEDGAYNRLIRLSKLTTNKTAKPSMMPRAIVLPLHRKGTLLSLLYSD